MSDTRVIEAVPVLAAGADVGEGPAWDAEQGRLLWVDITGSRVHEYIPGGDPDLPPTVRTWSVGCHVGAAVPAQGNELVLAVRDGIATLTADGAVRLVRPVESDLPRNRMNDAKCDPQGRLWMGTMPYESTPGAAALYRLDLDGTVTRVLDGVSLSNGLAWSPDGATMYYIDSETQRVDAFDFDRATGDIDARRAIVEVDPTDGLPDGMTVDDEGFLWVAVYGGGQVRRYAPDGRLDAVALLPVAQVTACAFGGPDHDTLYITTAAHGMDEDALAAQPHAGDLFAAHPGTTGPPATPFGAVPSSLV